MNDESQWHLDKRVPIALIVAIVLQSGGAFWWASNLTTRVTEIERRLEGFARRGEQADLAISRQQAQIDVLISQLANTNRNLDRLFGQVQDTNTLLRQLITDDGR